jgi:hypothetical protein
MATRNPRELCFVLEQLKTFHPTGVGSHSISNSVGVDNPCMTFSRWLLLSNVCYLQFIKVIPWFTEGRLTF